LKSRLLAPLLLAALVAAGWALSLLPVRVLEFANTDNGRVSRLLMSADASFFVTYHHSIYGQPVTEEFVLAPDDAIVLTGVQSASGAVLEYFGFADGAERHALERRLGEVVFRIAAGEPQRITLGSRDLSFLEFGEHGDRLSMAVSRMPLGRALLGAF
jgi:hypothetical protein